MPKQIFLYATVFIAAIVIPIIGVIATVAYTIWAILRTIGGGVLHLFHRPQLIVRHHRA